ncbi:hypothetical protein ACQPXM_24635 [Kribbella sp. CA-253562]|uniref:hypothetical protein n=1 Tax=Kribbella sp. CA-253562 TaxID=3239942 RepID=UPI003D8D48A3
MTSEAVPARQEVLASAEMSLQFLEPRSEFTREAADAVKYRGLPGDHLRTRWDDEPVVVVTNHRDAFGTVELSWATEPIREDWVPRRTRVVFDDVVEYHWRFWDVEESGVPEDFGLELGELEGSERVTALVNQGFDDDLRHFRISFDEHGRYDVICRTMHIDYEPGRELSPGTDDAQSNRPAGYYPAAYSCPSDQRVLLIAIVDDRLVLECKYCGRIYDTPSDLDHVRRPRPGNAPLSRPARLQEIIDNGWARFIRGDGNFAPD